jgi:predicted PurR-regulated permease PerM
LIAGLLEIIPYLGPWLGAVPAAVFALLLYGFPGLLAVAITYTLIQQLEEKLVVPVLMSKTLGVSPLLVFVCMLFGGVTMGVFGVVLAVPIAVIFSIIFPLPQEKKKQAELDVKLGEKGEENSEKSSEKKSLNKPKSSKRSVVKKPVKKVVSKSSLK